MAEETVLTIHVTCEAPLDVRGGRLDIRMIPFGGTCEGPYFSGRVIGTGVDTQKIRKDGSLVLSARYMLEGRDADGTPCRVFIVNQTDPEIGFRPLVVTDSPRLRFLEEGPLRATVEPAPGGVTVTVLAGR